MLIKTGPGSWLSICSAPAVQWVSAKAGTTRFHEIAQELVMGWTKRLTLSSDTIRETRPEPGFENAWKYVSGTQTRVINHMYAKVMFKLTYFSLF